MHPFQFEFSHSLVSRSVPLAITLVTVMKSWPADETVDFRTEADHSSTVQEAVATWPFR